MIIETIGYGESREVLMDNGMHEWRKPEIKAKLEERDNVLECLHTLKNSIDLFFKDVNAIKVDSSYFINNEEHKLLGNNLPKIEKNVKKSPLENMKDAIVGSSSLKVLDSFKLIVKNKPELKEIYDLTHKKLTNAN
jgi:hypothetical protein